MSIIGPIQTLKPKSTILITGAPCIGKSSVTRAFCEVVKGTYLIGETDVIRQVLRGDRQHTFDLQSDRNTDIDMLRSDLDLDILLLGLSEMNYFQLEAQSAVLLRPTLDLIRFAHKKNRSFLGEGTNIFLPGLFQELGTESLNQLYIFNLMMTDRECYKRRFEGRYGVICSENSDRFNNYFRMNRDISNRVSEFQKRHKNLYNLEVAGKGIANILLEIIETIGNVLI